MSSIPGSPKAGSPSAVSGYRRDGQGKLALRAGRHRTSCPPTRGSLQDLRLAGRIRQGVCNEEAGTP
ncbi:hypothetical protein ACWCQ0_30550 [Streptomyces massasporeus]|uniref:Uncharacterized protein n=1 Tax=Streptomyces massasporeus TaxID=67324 RepID=A0ABW6LHZ8_9ACTN